MLNYTLGVTSPMTTGPKVRQAQQRLNGRNVWRKDFHRGTVDGQFGEETGRSCIRAKAFLGYPTAELKATYGPYLDGFLSGELQLPDEFLIRQAARAKKAAQKAPREKALARALTQVGTTESPRGSNRQKFGDWYGMNGVPWCAIFVTWAYAGTGTISFKKGSRYAYVPYIVADARAGRYGLQTVREPLPGDVVCYDWDGGVADHVGLFEKWVDRGRGTFKAVEGNTAVGNDSNGGEVMRRERHYSQVEAFVRAGR